MLPDDTTSQIRLRVKDCTVFNSFKKELRTTINFLSSYDCLHKGRSAANAVENSP